jgi:phosphoglycolate phosphatase
MNKKILVLFDLDGTLIDTAPEMHMALNALLIEQRKETVSLDHVRPHVSNGVLGIFSAVFDDNPTLEGRRYNRYLKLYEDVVGTHASLFNDMDIVLSSIEKNHLWGIVTNKSRKFTEPLLRRLSLTDRLSCLICRDDVNNIKPDPEPLNLALSMLQFKDLNDCYYIGDSKKDIQSARSAGIKSIACSYGYRLDSDNPLSWGADYCVNKPNEIMEIIKC